jgi:hypothetical protein
MQECIGPSLANPCVAPLELYKRRNDAVLLDKLVWSMRLRAFAHSETEMDTNTVGGTEFVEQLAVR